MTSRSPRSHADRCPGVLRPWIAEDGALVRLRLVGGTLPTQALADLVLLAGRHGDGHVHLTRRANLQVRGLPHEDGQVSRGLVEEIAATGLLPAPRHELVRNIMVSPLSGRLGGRADLRPVAQRLDELLCADDELADLSGRFLFVLDDGRGDLVDRSLDLGLMAVDAEHAQVRVGEHWGDVVALAEAPEELLHLARRFRHRRGVGQDVPWHVAELPDAGESMLAVHHARDLRTQVHALPVPPGRLVQDDGLWCEHVPAPDGDLDHHLATQVLAQAGREVVVTPFRSILLPDLEPR